MLLLHAQQEGAHDVAGLRARGPTGRLDVQGHRMPPEGAGLAGNRKRGLGLPCSLLAGVPSELVGLPLGQVAWRTTQVMWAGGVDARPPSPGMGC